MFRWFCFFLLFLPSLSGKACSTPVEEKVGFVPASKGVKAQDHESCAWCHGAGQTFCLSCVSILTGPLSEGDVTGSQDCAHCQGRGVVPCSLCFHDTMAGLSSLTLESSGQNGGASPKSEAEVGSCACQYGGKSTEERDELFRKNSERSRLRRFHPFPPPHAPEKLKSRKALRGSRGLRREKFHPGRHFESSHPQ